ncbi:uncharacterized protein LOC127007894 [Eriocheir sinensis]|uniref:uncharacterized protein LOC127007894 n=1 Tax=Eriocheir sinensis TaxID=95602 RepID=UPI0021C5FD3C|nr:uncharacterized protein LOC127007894 [Eriocheir sinensis]
MRKQNISFLPLHLSFVLVLLFVSSIQASKSNTLQNSKRKDAIGVPPPAPPPLEGRYRTAQDNHIPTGQGKDEAVGMEKAKGQGVKVPYGQEGESLTKGQGIGQEHKIGQAEEGKLKQEGKQEQGEGTITRKGEAGNGEQGQGHEGKQARTEKGKEGAGTEPEMIEEQAHETRRKPVPQPNQSQRDIPRNEAEQESNPPQEGSRTEGVGQAEGEKNIGGVVTDGEATNQNKEVAPTSQGQKDANNGTLAGQETRPNDRFLTPSLKRHYEAWMRRIMQSDYVKNKTRQGHGRGRKFESERKARKKDASKDEDERRGRKNEIAEDEDEMEEDEDEEEDNEEEEESQEEEERKERKQDVNKDEDKRRGRKNEIEEDEDEMEEDGEEEEESQEEEERKKRKRDVNQDEDKRKTRKKELREDEDEIEEEEEENKSKKEEEANQAEEERPIKLQKRSRAINKVVIPGKKTDIPQPKKVDESCECGHYNARQARIVEGRETNKHHYPWMVSVQVAKGRIHFCGASIITREFVMTAAHCSYGFFPFELVVRVGDHNLAVKESSREKTVMVANIIEHPRYDIDTTDNDISLLRLAEELAFTWRVSPICLTPPNFTFYKETVKVMGWGRRFVDDTARATILRHVDLKVLPMYKCRYNFLLESEEVTSKMFCAEGGKKDTCQGDSGGPLVYLEHTQNRYFLVGVTSWGVGCGLPKYPGVYTKVSKFLEWVYEQTKDTPYCASYSPKPDRKKVMMLKKKKKNGNGKRRKTGLRWKKGRTMWRYEEIGKKENEVKQRRDGKMMEEEEGKKNGKRKERRGKLIKEARGKKSKMEEETNRNRIKTRKGKIAKEEKGKGKRRLTKERGKNNTQDGMKRRRKKKMMKERARKERGKKKRREGEGGE